MIEDQEDCRTSKMFPWGFYPSGATAEERERWIQYMQETGRVPEDMGDGRVMDRGRVLWTY